MLSRRELELQKLLLAWQTENRKVRLLPLPIRRRVHCPLTIRKRTSRWRRPQRPSNGRGTPRCSPSHTTNPTGIFITPYLRRRPTTPQKGDNCELGAEPRYVGESSISDDSRSNSGGCCFRRRCYGIALQDSNITEMIGLKHHRDDRTQTSQR
jgi:hypothetical protein